LNSHAFPVVFAAPAGEGLKAELLFPLAGVFLKEAGRRPVPVGNDNLEAGPAAEFDAPATFCP